MNYNDKVKFLLDKHNLSVKKFADILGVQRNFIYEVIRGKKQFSKQNEAILVNHFDLRTDYFLNDIRETITIDSSDELFYTLVPEAKDTNITLDKIRKLVKVLKDEDRS